MAISAFKSKILKLENKNEQNVMGAKTSIEGKVIEHVQDFLYLGSIVTKDGEGKITITSNKNIALKKFVVGSS